MSEIAPYSRVLLLDWGGTLMQSMPWYVAGEGWSYAPPLPHAEEVVTQLSASWFTALASNAGHLDEEETRTALATMGLGSVLRRFYSSYDTGSCKPYAPFWQHILRDLGVLPSQVVMVGDDYMTDIWGAAELGLFGVWLNTRNRECRQNARVRTIFDFSELPAALSDLGFAPC